MIRALTLLSLWSVLGAVPAAADAPAPAAPTVQLARFDPVRCASGDSAVRCLAGTASGPDGGSIPVTEEEGVRAKLAAELWVRLLEDTVIAWPDKTSGAGLALGKALKATALPERIFSTGPTLPGSGDAIRVQSRPAAPLAWLGAPGTGALFSQLRWQVPTGTDVPPTAILTGRFALRLAASGAPVQAELLGADPTSGLAFYQQMFPVSSGAQAAGFPVQPLAAFARPPGADDPWLDCATGQIVTPRPDLPSTGLPVQAASADLACMERLAGAHAAGFFRDLGLAILRFALPGTLPAQIRVLAASNAMVAPPGSWKDLPPVHLDDLVVASQGQLDPASMKGFPAPPPGPPGALTLDYAALPDPVVWAALAERTADPSAAATALHLVNAQISTLYAPLAVAAPAPLPSLDRDTFATWTQANAVPGRQSALFAITGWRTLEALVAALPDATRPAAERDLLLSQLHYQLYATLDPTKASAPKNQAGAAEKVWAGAMADHGVNVSSLPQAGPLLVDPTAVCTVGDGAAALGEKVSGAVALDLYFAVPTREDDPSGGLWARRADLPFLAIDDPAANLPTFTDVLTLPTGAEVYRARWQVWTGWHLLWRAVPAPAGEALSPAFGAVCSDLALAPADLLPALARATLRGEAPDAVRDAILAPLRAAAPEGGGTVVALADLTYADRHAFPIRLVPKDALALRQARLPKGSAATWLRGQGQAVVLSALPTADQVHLAPDLVPAPRPPTPPPGSPPDLVKKLADLPPRYRSATRSQAWSDAGLAVVTGLAAAGGTGPALDLRFGTASWFASAPRLGWTVGGGAQLLGLPYSDGAWQTPAPSAEVFVGLRVTPLPRLDRNATRGVAWGDTDAAGRRVIGRFEYGLLAVGGAGSGLSTDALYSGWLEPFAAWSLHPRGSLRLTFQPYFPGLWLGLSARVGLSAAGSQSCDVAVGSDLCLWGGLGLRAWALSSVGKKK